VSFNKKHFDVAIVGAGVAGLTLASRLKNLGASFTVLEKSKGVGGRMATRRDGGATFDHGAQFYTIGEQHSLFWHTQWLELDLSRKWLQNSEKTLFAAHGGMTLLAKNLSHELPIQFEAKVQKILALGPNQPQQILFESGNSIFAQKVYLSCPLPQSLQILKDSDRTFAPELNEIQYASAIVGLFCVDSTDPRLLDFQYQQNVNREIFSISNQQSKGVSAQLAFTVVLSPEASRFNFEKSDAENLSFITQLWTSYWKEQGLKANYQITRSQLKKWRYSHPVDTWPKPFEVVSREPFLCLLGDAFGGPSLNGAVSSALATPIDPN
jgi:renalase